ncbi:uncharacterized protein LOC115631823 [Scaptodrosophila lebanonensis]|uniref:Uncharacterized protein LOC115631823 n=1 Tax=Drosophila lebanonensis TaxID=7225 RepID=A0A6J2UAL7_DROLE|nr:uncharacterized protein LOC115631823 [Scaptodrosophila lebanonensis]
MQSTVSTSVPMQPYAGQSLIIGNFPVPTKVESKSPALSGPTPSKQPKLIDMNMTEQLGTKPKQRPSYFERSSIAKRILKYCNIEECSDFSKDEAVELLLPGLETYMKYVVDRVIELCDHRSGYHLANDKRVKVEQDMRTTMMFLNDLEMGDSASSDGDGNYNRRRRWASSIRSRLMAPQPGMETANTTAMMALGPRKPNSSDSPGRNEIPVAPVPVQRQQRPQQQHQHQQQQQQQRQIQVSNYKRINIRDVFAFMSGEKRYNSSNMFFDAYLKYKH